MIEELQRKIGDEAETLLHELNVILPKEIEKAVAQGDLRENSEYTAALERQGFVRARLDYLARRMSQLGELDIENIPTDRVGFGSKVAVRDLEDVREFEFPSTSRSATDGVAIENNDISMESPIGRALLGKRKGALVSVRLPAGAREFEVVDFETLHDL